MPKATSSTTSSSGGMHAPPVPVTLTDSLPLPSLVVFDLDYTLWPFWVDTHISAPIKAVNTPASSVAPSYISAVRDKQGESFAFYAHCPAILSVLKANPNITVAAASRTNAPELAREMLRTLQIPWIPSICVQAIAAEPSSTASKAKKADKDRKENTKPRKAIEFFDNLEIYPGSKLKHFEKLHKATGIEYKDMLFFDDERRNREVEKLGVTMWWVPDGVTCKTFDDGVTEWRKRRDVHGKDEEI